MSLDVPFDQLKNDIFASAGLGAPEATGFHAMYCPMCGKEDRKTAGFKFEPESIVFHCFRGSCDGSCVMTQGEPVSRKFRRVMETIGVTIPVELRMVKSSIRKAMDEALDESLYKKHVYDDMQMPDGWIPLSEAPKANYDYWADYFGKRAVPLSDIRFITKNNYKGLTAIPMYYFDKLIGFQVVNPVGKAKYITESPNNNLIYLSNPYPQNPIIMVEGILDAKCFPNTAGVLHSRVSPEQAYALRGKDVIMLPDRHGNRFIEQVEEYGWKMCIPPWDESDLNKAVIRYGVMVVAQMIRDNTFTSMLDIEVRHRMWMDKAKEDK